MNSRHSGIRKSMRRHVKLNHSAVGGVSHTGGVRVKTKPTTRRDDDRPDPMKVTLADFIDIPKRR